MEILNTEPINILSMIPARTSARESLPLGLSYLLKMTPAELEERRRAVIADYTRARVGARTKQQRARRDWLHTEAVWIARLQAD